MEIHNYIENVVFLRSNKNNINVKDFFNALINLLDTNNNGCEMIISLFFAALYSYKSGSCLKPFPPRFSKNGSEDVASLRKLCETVPSLKEYKSCPEQYSIEVFNLFSWLFIEKPFPLLEEVTFESLVLNNNISSNYKPDYVFKIHHCPKQELSFQRRIGDKGIISAFHGSRVENFFSILKFGLQQHFSSEKETIYGKGIYLSSELSVSAFFSPYGETWKNSSLGNSHSVIAVCDIINDVNKVRCKDSKHKRRSLNANSTAEIPDKYFVVTDNEMVQLKYLMVYRRKTLVKPFFFRNLYWISLILYFLMLIFIGSQGLPWKKMMNIVLSNVSL